jgi:hypothetical protein
MTSRFVRLAAIGAFALCATFSAAALGQNLTERVRFEIDSVGLHPGMEPGMYVCAGGHLHIKGTVQNLTATPLGNVKVGAKAFDAQGNLLGTATASTKKAITPGERGEIDIEFLTVTGGMLDKVKRHEVTVLDAPAKSR